MRKPPPISQLPRFPITGGIALLAIVVSLAYAAKWNIEPLLMNAVLLPTQPWRLLTTTLPHEGFFHLAFNVYWLWVFGSALEKYFGQLRYLAIIILIAAASSAAEFAFLDGGIGLSGVGYGLFGILLIMSRKKSQLADIIDKQTTILFIAWFFFCIFTTITGKFPVANIAHGSGAVIGILVGWLATQPPNKKILPAATLSALILIIALATTVFRTTVNFSADSYRDYFNAAYDAGSRNEYEKALAYYKHAIAFRHCDPSAWYNIGVTYNDMKRPREALPYFEEAARRDTENKDFAAAVKEARRFVKFLNLTEAQPPDTQPTSHISQ